MKHFLLIIILNSISFLAFSQSEIWVLDSFYHYTDVTEEAFQIDYYQYDDKGRMIEKTTLLSSNSLKNQRRTFQFFDVENIEIESIYQQEQNSDVWTYECEIEKEFNFLGQTIREKQLNCPDYYIPKLGRWNELTHKYDESGRLIETITNDESKQFWTYDENGNLLEQGTSSWDETINNWSEPRFFLQRRYGENGKISYQRQVAHFMGDIFDISEYSYDSLNREIEVLYSVEWLGNPEPQLRLKSTSYYTGNDLKLDSITYQFWYQDTWQLPYTREIYNYDNFGNISERIRQQLDSNGNPFNEGRRFYFYNDDNLLEEFIAQVWVHGNLVSQNRSSYSYNDDNLVEELIKESWTIDNQQWTIEEIKTYTYYPDKVLKSETIAQIQTDYQNERISKKIYYRSQKTISQPNNDVTTCLFPNPYMNQQQVYCEALEADKEYDFMAFNLLGQVVYQTNFLGQNGFRVEKQLEQGWYVFVVFDNGKILQKQKVWIY